MWTCPKCEQNNLDSDNFCPLCGAAKALKREAPVYDTPKPAPAPKAAPPRAPAAAAGGAWGTVGDWRRDAKDKKEYEDAVAAASRPTVPTSVPNPAPKPAPKPAATKHVVAPLSASAPASAADKPLTEKEADRARERITESIKKIKWYRVGIFGTTLALFGLNAILQGYSALGGVWSVLFYLTILVPAFLLGYKAAVDSPWEWLLSIIFNYAGVILTVFIIMRSSLPGIMFFVPLLLIALFVGRQALNRNAVFEMADVVEEAKKLP